ncbi:MAG TPA: hypothetical protein VF812_11390 [Ktedonobacterales bacterium]
MTWTRTSLERPILQSVSFTARADGAGYYGIAVAWSADHSTASALVSRDSGATWALLPALSFASHSPYVYAAIGPAGDALAQDFSGQSLYLCHPSAPSPQWSAFAAGMAGEWRVTSGLSGARLWSLQVENVTGPGSQVAYLSLP